MKFIPILFSTPMVQAILEGRKTQTRRVVKPQPQGKMYKEHLRETYSDTDWGATCKCPYGQPGDILWVRETFGEDADNSSKYFFKADFPNLKIPKWKPSIFMPKEASRIFLRVKSVRVEHLTVITPEDAIAEGIEKVPTPHLTGVEFAWRDYGHKDRLLSDPVASYRSLWDAINGRGSWDKNPWVWVIEFERIEKPENFI